MVAPRFVRWQHRRVTLAAPRLCFRSTVVPPWQQRRSLMVAPHLCGGSGATEPGQHRADAPMRSQHPRLFPSQQKLGARGEEATVCWPRVTLVARARARRRRWPWRQDLEASAMVTDSRAEEARVGAGAEVHGRTSSVLPHGHTCAVRLRLGRITLSSKSGSLHGLQLRRQRGVRWKLAF